MRLATLLDVHLELRVRGVEALQQGIELRLFLARQQRQHPAGLGQQAIGHSRGHLVEVAPDRHRLVVDEPEELAFPDGDAVQLGVAGGDGGRRR